MDWEKKYLAETYLKRSGTRSNVKKNNINPTADIEYNSLIGENRASLLTNFVPFPIIIILIDEILEGPTLWDPQTAVGSGNNPQSQ